MGFFQRSFRARQPVGTRGPIFAVGWHAYVACAGDRPAPLMLTDASGAEERSSLADGTEVEILAWRPRSGGTWYRVRSTCADLEGWLPAGSLRRAESVISSAPTPPAASAGRVRRQQRAGSSPRLGKRSA